MTLKNHKLIGDGNIHQAHNWTYADLAERTGATGFIAEDIFKVALQESDSSLWILSDTTPTWVPIGGGAASNPLAQVVIVAKSGGDFTSVKSAVESIVDAAITKPYVVRVAPGFYVEDPFEVAPWITLEGDSGRSVLLQTTNMNAHFITGASASVIKNITINGPTGVGFASISHEANAVSAMILDYVFFANGYYGLWVHPSTSRGSVYAFKCIGSSNPGGTVKSLFRCTDYGSMTLVSCGYIQIDTTTVETTYDVSGPNAEATINVAQIVNPELDQTNGLYVDDGAYVHLTGGLFGGGVNALNIGPNGSNTKVEVLSTDFSSDYTLSALIQSPTAVVFYTGSAPQGKVSAVAGAKMVALYTSTTPGEEGTVIIGESWAGFPGSSIPISSYLRGSSSTGLVSGGEILIGTGLNIEVAAGEGFIRTATGVVPISWDAETLSVAANLDEYHVVVDSANIVHVVDSAALSLTDRVELGSFATNSTAVVGISQHAAVLLRNFEHLSRYLRETRAHAVVSGCTASNASPPSLTLAVDSGVYYLAQYRLEIGANSPVDLVRWYRDGSGGWTKVASQSAVDPGNYDDGTGTLASLTTSYFKKDMLYLSGNDGGVEYHLVYAHEDHATEELATDGGEVSPPSFLEKFCIRIAAVVSQQGATDIAAIIDRRPNPNADSSPTGGTGGTTVHDDLTGRSLDGNHPQYQLISLKGLANGYPGLDAGSKVPISNIPADTAAFNASHIKGEFVDDADKANGRILQFLTASGNLEYVDPPLPTHSLGVHSDVLLTALATGNALQWNGANWVNIAPPLPVFGTEHQRFEDLPPETTTSETFQAKVTGSTTNLPLGNYRVGWSFGWNCNSKSIDFSAHITVDGAVEMLHLQEPKEAGGTPLTDGITGSGTDQVHRASGFFYLDAVSGVLPITLDFRTTNSGTLVGIKDARLELWRVP